MFASSRSPARGRTRLFLEELESRTLLSASIVDALLAAPQTLLSPSSQSSEFMTPQKKPGGGGGGGGTTTPPGYSPSQIQTAYGFNQISFSNGPNGTGQTIAIVDAYNDANVWSDLSTFDTQYHLTNPTLTVMNQSGQVLSTNGQKTTVTPPSADASGGWELEESLDVEWAHAMAPGANLVLVEANSSSISDLLAAVQTAANNAAVVSMSWGAAEFSGETGDDSTFTHSGVTYVAASGDSGAPPIWPAVSPNVVAVGGTSLTIGSSGNYVSESGWSSSGGGISAYESLPAYQDAAVANNPNIPGGTPTTRTNPDVAYNANPNTGYAVYDSTTYYPYYPIKIGGSSGWIEVGGTSAAAPQWSALIAIADQGRQVANNNAPNPLSGASQTLPAIYNMASSDFHDITSGTSTGSPSYSAGPGYDLVTGRGTPYAQSVIAALENATSTGGVSGLVVSGGSGTSTSPSVTTVLAEGTGAEADSAADFTIGSPALPFLPLGMSSLAFGAGQLSAAPGGTTLGSTSSSLAAVPGFRITALGFGSGSSSSRTEERSEEAMPASDACFSDEAGMALLGEETLAAANNDGKLL